MQSQTLVSKSSNGLLALSIALWTAQILLAALFGMAGWMKSSTPIAVMAQSLPWVAQSPELLVRFIGAAELAGAIGLILPALTRIQPILTPLAGAGLSTVMVLASLFHASRGEFGAIGFNMVVLVATLFVVWGRFKAAPIEPK